MTDTPCNQRIPSDLTALSAAGRELLVRDTRLADELEAAERRVSIPWPPELIRRPSDDRLPLLFLRPIGDRIGPDIIDGARQTLADADGMRGLARDVVDRLREIAEAGDRYRRARTAAEQREGVDCIRERMFSEAMSRDDILRRAAAIPARGVDDVLLKLRVAACDIEAFAFDSQGDALAVERLLASIVADALALASEGDADTALMERLRPVFALAQASEPLAS